MKDKFQNFLKIINIDKTHIKDKLPFIWVFGAGGEHVLDMHKINNPLHPEHHQFLAYKDLTAQRAKYIQWCLREVHVISKFVRVPEQYPEWINFQNLYTNLVDFEMDIAAISRGALIFSEGVGTYAEIGMFSCLTDLHKNLLIVSEQRFIQPSCTSFFNLGPIAKIKENKISDDLNNIWSLDEPLSSSQEIDDLFDLLSDHFLDIITSSSGGKFNPYSKHHVTLLLLDLIALFPKQNRKFYITALENFSVTTKNFNIRQMMQLLSILDLIEIKSSGNNEIYYLKTRSSYYPCIKYQGDNKRFDRIAFNIEKGN